MESGAAALARLCDPEAKVSAHYTVDEDGTVFAHVPEECRAWHAGVSFWAGARDVNARSIGIEIVNPGHEFGYRSFPKPQIGAVIRLARSIVDRHGIPPERVLGHSDVAPARKRDPGELFPWAALANPNRDAQSRPRCSVRKRPARLRLWHAPRCGRDARSRHYRFSAPFPPRAYRRRGGRGMFAHPGGTSRLH
jgi:N-acetyl-anhydromuramyl-L-alanine amidase AmpD